MTEIETEPQSARREVQTVSPGLYAISYNATPITGDVS